ncbi:hypothetical protein ACRAWF_36345 [Streptomyces sp. L7]
MFIWRTLRGEWQGIVVDPVRQLLRRGLPEHVPGVRRAPSASSSSTRWRSGRPVRRSSRHLGGVQGDLPLWLALLRTPISLYVPALDLPVWAGITQLFLAFALAELALGRVRTLVVAYATTLAGTLTVRVMLLIRARLRGHRTAARDRTCPRHRAVRSRRRTLHLSRRRPPRARRVRPHRRIDGVGSRS